MSWLSVLFWLMPMLCDCCVILIDWLYEGLFAVLQTFNSTGSVEWIPGVGG